MPQPVMLKKPKNQYYSNPSLCPNQLCWRNRKTNITVIQVYAPTSYAEETEVEQFYEDLSAMYHKYTLIQGGLQTETLSIKHVFFSIKMQKHIVMIWG